LKPGKLHLGITPFHHLSISGVSEGIEDGKWLGRCFLEYKKALAKRASSSWIGLGGVLSFLHRKPGR
jgi:hypothetical protein